MRYLSSKINEYQICDDGGDGDDDGDVLSGVADVHKRTFPFQL
jgi:hypothetical protein